jgi:hypothetical protein
MRTPYELTPLDGLVGAHVRRVSCQGSANISLGCSVGVGHCCLHLVANSYASSSFCDSRMIVYGPNLRFWAPRESIYYLGLTDCRGSRCGFREKPLMAACGAVAAVN